jgi:E3 ubiquitin-protein ligase TRIP12
VIGALQLVDLLLTKVPLQYKPTFRREGVFHEIEVLAVRDVASSTKSKDKDKEASEAPSPPESGNVVHVPPPPVSAPTIPGFKKLSSLSLEPEDAITLRARIIRFKYLASDEQAEGDSAFETLRRLVGRISARDASEKELFESLRDLADLFASPHTSVSSFELLQSGVVDGLLPFATDHERTRKDFPFEHTFITSFSSL